MPRPSKLFTLLLLLLPAGVLVQAQSVDYSGDVCHSTSPRYVASTTTVPSKPPLEERIVLYHSPFRSPAFEISCLHTYIGSSTDTLNGACTVLPPVLYLCRSAADIFADQGGVLNTVGRTRVSFPVGSVASTCEALAEPYALAPLSTRVFGTEEGPSLFWRVEMAPDTQAERCFPQVVHTIALVTQDPFNRDGGIAVVYIIIICVGAVVVLLLVLGCYCICKGGMWARITGRQPNVKDWLERAESVPSDIYAGQDPDDVLAPPQYRLALPSPGDTDRSASLAATDAMSPQVTDRSYQLLPPRREGSVLSQNSYYSPVGSVGRGADASVALRYRPRSESPPLVQLRDLAPSMDGPLPLASMLGSPTPPPPLHRSRVAAPGYSFEGLLTGASPHGASLPPLPHTSRSPSGADRRVLPPPPPLPPVANRTSEDLLDAGIMLRFPAVGRPLPPTPAHRDEEAPSTGTMRHRQSPYESSPPLCAPPAPLPYPYQPSSGLANRAAGHATPARHISFAENPPEVFSPVLPRSPSRAGPDHDYSQYGSPQASNLLWFDSADRGQTRDEFSRF